MTDLSPDVLAARLARAFPAWEDRSAIAREAGLADAQLVGEARAVWRDLVADAVERGRLDALVRAADGRRPGWNRGSRAPWVVGVVVLVAVAVAYSVTSPNPAPVPVPDQALTQPSPSPAPAPAPSEPPTPPPPPPPSAEPVEAAPPPRPAPAPEPPTPPPPPAPSSGTGTGTGTGTGCQGWAYLGETTSVTANPTWTVDRSYNVRADYPRRDNGYALARTVCALQPGQVVSVDAPVAVDGGVWWARVERR